MEELITENGSISVNRKQIHETGHTFGRWCWCEPDVANIEGEWVIRHRDVMWQ